MEQIKIHKSQREESSPGDQTVYGVSGPVRVSVDIVCDDALDAMMEAHHREGNTYTSGKAQNKCRCGCT